MDNPFEMISFIVFAIAFTIIVRSMFGGRRDRKHDRASVRDDGEVRALRDEVARLRDRLEVLERITVEKENSLEREIESLRDRPALAGRRGDRAIP